MSGPTPNPAPGPALGGFGGPTVTVVLPVLDEERHIVAALDAIGRQTYEGIVEVLVVDGGSADGTRALAAQHRGVRVLDNPLRIQSAGMNVALAAARGDILVRADGHSILADDYVERCVETLAGTGAAVVGGSWLVQTDTPVQRGIGAAIMSRFGFSAARFDPSLPAGWRDSVSFGAYRVAVARRVGGYDASMPVNEDAEFAHRMAPHGGIWFEPRIQFTYVPRSSYAALARQFFRYGRGRAVTVRRHPASLAPRQLAAPLLVAGLVSPWRRRVLAGYAGLLGLAALDQWRRDPGPLPAFLVALPTIHLAWGTGFLVGLGLGVPQPGASVEAAG